jgi:mannitol-specific phosphotransferase system IIBC component
VNGKDVRKIVVACDAGMGSSVMLAGQLRRELKKFSVQVEHTPVNNIPADADVVVFLGDPAVTGLVSAIKNGGEISA